MKICVTGCHTGLGAALVERLRGAGHEVVGLGTTAVDPVEAGPVAAVVDALRGCGAVVHLAARHGAGLDLDAMLRAAVSRTANLLLAMRLAGVTRLVHASTVAVYGRAERTPIAEDAPLRPDNASQEIQRIAEKLATAFSRGPGARVTILRLASVFGGPAPEDPLAAWIEAVRAGAPVKLSGGGRSRSAPLHVDDAVSAIVAALERPQDEPLLAINVAGGEAVTDSELSDLVAEVSGRPVARVASDDAEAVDLVPDIGLARRRLGFSPRPLRDAIAAMVARAP